MNSDSDFPLIDRYLDGVATEDDASALAETIEADPDALAALCEAAGIEASLRRHLATPEQRRAMTPRIAPLWHWRRAGKWIAAGAAAAALVVVAAVLFWPAKPYGTGKHTQGLASGMTVKRFSMGERGAAPLQAPAVQEDAGPMRQAEFHPGEKWLEELRTFKLSEPGDAYPSDKDEVVTADEYLVRYLRASGVTFPNGAVARWQSGQSAFSAVNTAENIARIAAIEQDPASRGPRFITLDANVWKFRPGALIPPLLATERVLSAAERQVPREESKTFFFSGPNNGRLFRMILSEDTEGTGVRVYCDMLVDFRRVGDHILISGLSGMRPEGSGPVALQDFADMEFSLTLLEGEEAVIHLGRKPDGADWIMSMQARLSPVPTVTLRDVPNVMKFDRPVLTVKAGSPVRLLHKNDACVLPHNFVLVKPGTAAAVGALADQMLADPDALAKLYLPASPDILVTGTRLLKRGESEEILFTAPTEPGDYPYLCTFPGHWRLQQGILRVER